MVEAAAVLAEVAAEYGLEMEAITGRRRYRPLVAARRQIAQRLRADGYLWKQVGLVLKRHHSTAVNLVRKKVKARSEFDRCI